MRTSINIHLGTDDQFRAVEHQSYGIHQVGVQLGDWVSIQVTSTETCDAIVRTVLQAKDMILASEIDAAEAQREAEENAQVSL